MAFGLGESVGTAYVRIVADGSGLDQSIRNEVNDAIDDAHLDSAGSRAGRDFTEGMDKEFEKKLGKGPGWKKGLENLELSMARQLKLQRYFDSPNWKKFVKRAEEEFGDVGFIAAKEIEKEFIENSKSLNQVSEEQVNFARRIQTIRIKQAEETAKRLAQIAKDEAEDVARAQGKIRDEVNDTSNAFTRFAKNADAFGDRLGKAFGSGSRNNFFNIFGGFVSIIPNAAASFARLGNAAKPFFDEFSKGFSSLEEGASFFTKLGAGASRLAPMLSGPLAAGALGAAAAIIALEVAASTLSLTAGGLTAVIGTVGTGLVGGIGLLTAALVPLAAGIGSVAIAWVSMSDAQKEAFSKGVQPLTKAFSTLGDIAAENIFDGLGQSLARMTPFMNSLAGATNAVTLAVRQQIDSWVALVNSGAFNGFVNTITRDLPGQIASLNRIFQGFATAFAGFFTAVSPTLSRFLRDLSLVVKRFSDWTNSARGQNAIGDFFDTALDSLRAMGRTLVSAGRLLGNFFRIGAEGGGNELFQSLADTFDDWNKALIENQDEVKEWVQDGADFLRTLGDLVVGVTKLIAALDTPFMRTVITESLKSMAFGFELTAKAIELCWKSLQLLDPILNPIEQGFKNLGDTLGWIGDKFGLTSDDAEKTSKSLAETATSADKTTVAMDSTATAVSKAARELARLGRAQNFLERMRDLAHESAAGFKQLARETDNAKLSANEWMENIREQARALRNFGENIRTLAEKGLKEGLINQLIRMGPEGTRAAQELVNGGKPKIDQMNSAFKGLSDATRDYTKNIASARNATKEPIKITADVDQALQGVNSVQGAINKLSDKQVTITANLAVRRIGEAANLALDAFRFASGGIVTSPTRSIAGESGPEAIVPLRRPLGLVDPSVRGLSAIAQGKAPVGTNGKTLNVGPITVNTPTTDPRAVAVETVNRLALVGGF